MQVLNQTPEGGSKKNAFELSNFETFHQKGGQFNIVGIRDTLPDSDYEMSVDGVTRTKLCNTANFARMKENYYFIHVPLGLISRNAYMMQVQREEKYSSLRLDISQMPVFSLGKIWAAIVTMIDEGDNRPYMPGDDGPVDNPNYTPEYFDEYGFNIGYGAIRILDNCGCGYFGDVIDMWQAGTITKATCLAFFAQFNDKYLSVARPAAYQCAWYHFFRNSIYDNDVSPDCFNFDDICFKAADDSVVNWKVDEVRGAVYFVRTTLRLRYNPCKKDIFTAAMPGTQWGAVSTVNLDSDLEVVLDDVTTTRGVYSETNTGVYPRTGDIVGANRLGVIRNNPANSVTGEYGDIVSDYAPNSSTGVRLVQEHQHVLDGVGGLSGGQSLFDVLSLVEAQAIQKWRQKSMLAGNRTRDQWKAHYGVVPRHLVDHVPDFIGSVDNEIFVKEITSQANTLADDPSTNNLGDIRGRGYGATDNRTFKFHCNDYGVLLLIHAIVPENTYSSFGIDRGNTMIFNTDFPQQEYQNIGLDVVPKFTLDAQSDVLPTDSHGTGTDAFADVVDEGAVGYAPYKYWFKEYPSRVHGLFNPPRIISLNEEPSPTHPLVNVYGYADFQSFVLTRQDMISNVDSYLDETANVWYDTLKLSMQIGMLYVNPRLFDTIFSLYSDSTYTTDQFFSHIRFHCNALQPLTVLGLPKF